jgi:hypothetical protein
MAGTREVRLVRLAARLNGDMRGLSSAKTGWRRSGAAARRPKVRLFGRVDAPLCGRPAKKQSRNEQHHAGDFGVRSCGDGALHLGPLTWAQPGASCRPPENPSTSDETEILSRCTDEIGQQQPTLEQIAKFFNKPVGNVPGLNNSVMPWKIAKDGSVTNGLA